jgi:hypothetical protein
VPRVLVRLNDLQRPVERPNRPILVVLGPEIVIPLTADSSGTEAAIANAYGPASPTRMREQFHALASHRHFCQPELHVRIPVVPAWNQ